MLYALLYNLVTGYIRCYIFSRTCYIARSGYVTCHTTTSYIMYYPHYITYIIFLYNPFICYLPWSTLLYNLFMSHTTYLVTCHITRYIPSISCDIKGEWARRLQTPTPSFSSQFNTTTVQDWLLEFRVSRNSNSHSPTPMLKKIQELLKCYTSF